MRFALQLVAEPLNIQGQLFHDVAVLFGGDGDYIPLVEEVKRLGKLVYVAFFDDDTVSDDLKMAADRFFDLSELLVQTWTGSE